MTHYEIRVDGRLSTQLITAFPALASQVCQVQTVLHGDLPDQAALLGVLLHLDELGVRVLDVRMAPGAAASGGGYPVSDAAEQA